MLKNELPDLPPIGRFRMSITSSLRNIQALTIQDFQEDGTIVHPVVNKRVSFVFFYLPYCRFCQDMAGSFSQFSKQNSGTVTTAGVDVTAQSNLGIMTHLRSAPFALNMFPTVIVYFNGYPCSVYQRGAPGSDEVGQLTSALQAAQRGCGSCTLSACRT
jgi:thioredoxin-like negative regulator of GroEL